jgi:hypothetical protein
MVAACRLEASWPAARAALDKEVAAIKPPRSSSGVARFALTRATTSADAGCNAPTY